MGAGNFVVVGLCIKCCSGLSMSVFLELSSLEGLRQAGAGRPCFVVSFDDPVSEHDCFGARCSRQLPGGMRDARCQKLKEGRSFQGVAGVVGRHMNPWMFSSHAVVPIQERDNVSM